MFHDMLNEWAQHKTLSKEINRSKPILRNILPKNLVQIPLKMRAYIKFLYVNIVIDFHRFMNSPSIIILFAVFIMYNDNLESEIPGRYQMIGEIQLSGGSHWKA